MSSEISDVELTGNSRPARHEERLNQIDALLDDYEQSSGLPAYAPMAATEVHHLLELSPQELRGMSAEEVGEAAYTLESFSFHLQRALNREQARVRFAEETVRYLIGPRMRNITAYNWEERRLLAVRQDDAAQKAEKLRVNAQLRVERLSYLSPKVERMASALIQLQMSKRAQRRD